MKRSDHHCAQLNPAGPAWLFAPADRPERFGKAADAADMVILDLEDGCRAENRAEARRNIQAADADPQTTVVRINPANSEDFAADLKAVAATKFRLIMLAKVESAEDIDAVVRELPDACVIALIETPRGVLRAEDIAAHESVAALFWGAEDLTAGLGGTRSRFGDGTYRDHARFARTMVHFAAAVHGKGALDAVNVDISDTDLVAREADNAAAAGFIGKCCIHPAQVAHIREAFAPTDDELEWAQGLLDAASRNSGAFSYRGSMVDEPLFAQAQSIVSRAGQSADYPDLKTP